MLIIIIIIIGFCWVLIKWFYIKKVLRILGFLIVVYICYLVKFRVSYVVYKLMVKIIWDFVVVWIRFVWIRMVILFWLFFFLNDFVIKVLGFIYSFCLKYIFLLWIEKLYNIKSILNNSNICFGLVWYKWFWFKWMRM